MEIFATAFTIPTEINVRKKAPKKMPVSFSPVLFDKLLIDKHKISVKD